MSDDIHDIDLHAMDAKTACEVCLSLSMTSLLLVQIFMYFFK